jgi:colicin import membrane protein
VINKSYHPALIFSVGLHFIILAVLLLGDFSTENKPVVPVTQMAPIQAVMIDQSKVNQLVEKLRKEKSADKAAEKKRLRDAENELSQANKKRKKEEARIKKLERERKAKIKEKKKADAAAKKSKLAAQAAEKSRKEHVAQQKIAEKSAADAKAKQIKEQKKIKDKKIKDEKIAKDKALKLKQKKLADDKRKKEEAIKRVQQEKILAQQMEEEMAGRQQARSQQVMSEINRYTALIIASIQRNLITDQSSMENKSCKLTISLSPSGFVTNVVIGAGDQGVCQASKTAIYKAGTLPVSKDPEVFKEMRKISVTVQPEF